MSVQALTLIRPPVMPMSTNMRHVVQLVLPLTQFVATLSRRLRWSDFVNLLPLNSLDKHERQPGEEAPIGLILCAESSLEQVVLLQMHKDGITVAECWTELPLRADLEQELMQLCWRRVSSWRGAGFYWGTWMRNDVLEGSQGLGFLIAGLAGVGQVPAKGEDGQEAARVFYVTATRATQRLVIGVGGDGGLGRGWRTGMSLAIHPAKQ